MRRRDGRPIRIVLAIACLAAFAPPADAASRPAGEGADARPSAAEQLAEEARVERVPVGVDFASPLPAGSFRFRYDWRRVYYAGYRNRRTDLSVERIRNRGYSQVPTRLERDRHTLSFAYAPHDRITLIAHIPIEVIEQNGRRPLPGDEHYERSTTGLGDVSLTAVVPFIRKHKERSIIHVGFSAPTGDIRRKAGDPLRLGYPARLGTGSWGINWGMTYRGESDWLSWGAQGGGVFALNDNDFEYRVGAHFDASAWLAATLSEVWTGSFRLGWSRNGEVHGDDAGLNRDFEPASNPKHRGNTTIDLLPGMSLQLPGLDGQRLAVELSVPVYQKVVGPQLERDWTLSAGWQWTF